MEDEETSAAKDIENLEKELEELKEATNELKGYAKESKAVQIQRDILIRNRENMCVSANTTKCVES